MNEEKYEIDNIVESTASTIVNYNLDTAIDFSEIGLDSLLNDSVLKEVPLIKTAYGVAKTVFAVREKHMIRKTLTFIKQLNDNGISNENYNQYKEKLKNKDKFVFKELEHILIIIDRYVELNKNKILANLYFNYIDRKINWTQFQELSIIVDNIFMSDIDELEHIYQKRYITMNEIKNRVSFRRLKVQNLIEDIESMLRMEDGSIGMFYNENDYKITSLGILLFEYGINKGVKKYENK